MRERYAAWFSDGRFLVEVDHTIRTFATPSYVCDDPMCTLRITGAEDGSHWKAIRQWVARHNPTCSEFHRCSVEVV